MNLNKLTNIIIGKAITIHRELGPGLLESAYETCLEHELRKVMLDVKRQHPVPIVYEQIHMQYGYRIDLLVNNRIVIEIKTVDAFLPVHRAQILTYMKFAQKELGLLINFNVPLLKDGIRRYRL